MACNLPMGFEILSKHSNRKESPDSGGKPGTVVPSRTELQESCRLPKRKRTRMAICTYNARTLASEAAIEDLMMQAKKIKYDVIATRRRPPLNAVYETGEELFLRTCDSRGVGGVGVPVNTSMAKNINSFEQLTTRIGRLRMRRCGPTPALTIFVAYAPTSSYEEEEVEAFYMDLEKRRSCLLQGHNWRFQRQSWPKKNAGGTSHGNPRPTMERPGGEALRVHHDD
ncbi:hypothetical protein NECAME_12347 [Necator americanus]|uniref:Uncharacterized protein n=1 Tax=Necator americanus TaxID=51031 RepID=W2T0E5_NECAM|nr:hypothetical protein NECAME_12347 [Necator americanus]ETN75480.1 hypothetical protein NECAME_12347 [Necator americanus]